MPRFYFMLFHLGCNISIKSNLPCKGLLTICGHHTYSEFNIKRCIVHMYPHSQYTYLCACPSLPFFARFFFPWGTIEMEFMVVCFGPAFGSEGKKRWCTCCWLTWLLLLRWEIPTKIKDVNCWCFVGIGDQCSWGMGDMDMDLAMVDVSGCHSNPYIKELMDRGGYPESRLAYLK